MDDKKSIEPENSFLEIERQRIPSISSDDDESFVVLARSSNGDIEEEDGFHSLPPVDNQKIRNIQEQVNDEISKVNAAAECAQQQMQDLVSPTASLRSTESYDETQKKVEDLIKENEVLKNTIEQNNLSMKAQCQKLEHWKGDVNKSYDAYKKKLVEAKTAIDKQKEVNKKLAEEVLKFKAIKELQDEEIMQLRKSLNDESDKISNVTNVLEMKNFSEFELETTRKKLQEKEALIASFETEKQKHLTEIRELKARLEVREEQYSFEQYSLNELRRESIEKDVKYEENERKLRLEISECKDECQRLRDEIENNPAVVAKNQNYESEIATLKQSVASLLERIDPNLEEKYEQVRLQLSSAQKSLTQMQVKLADTQTEINVKNKEFTEIRTKIEENEILRAQLEIYTKDFEAESLQRRALQDEKDQLQDDMNNLLRRNHELQEIVENVRERDREVTTAASSRSSKSSKSSSSSTTPPKSMKTPKGGYYCPRCSRQFTSYEILEDHVNWCLDLS